MDGSNSKLSDAELEQQLSNNVTQLDLLLETTERLVSQLDLLHKNTDRLRAVLQARRGAVSTKPPPAASAVEESSSSSEDEGDATTRVVGARLIEAGRAGGFNPVKHPGALTHTLERQHKLGKGQEGHIPRGTLETEAHKRSKGGHMTLEARRAQLAITMRGWHHGGSD